MTLMPRIRALLSLHKASLCQFSLSTSSPLFGYPSTEVPTKQNASDANPEQNASDAKPEGQKENESLVESLTLMGVDVNMVRQRRPAVLRMMITNEQGLLGFLESKGASRTQVAHIINRYPHAIVRSAEALDRRWELWRCVFKSDSEILSSMVRRPRAFYELINDVQRTFKENILFLRSRGLEPKVLKWEPRIITQPVERNRQMVEFLEDVCAKLGGKDPKSFANTLITEHCYTLCSSINTVQANIDFLRVSLKLGNLELLDVLQSYKVSIVLSLPNASLKNNSKMLEQRLLSEGCRREDIRTMLTTYPRVLKLGPDQFNYTLDCLLKRGITVEQVMKQPMMITNEQGLLGFLERKGASRTQVLDLINRYPHTINHSGESLDQRWEIWRRCVYKSDSEIISSLVRRPAAFFNSQLEEETVKENILFLRSRGLDPKELLKWEPSVITQPVERNRQMVEFLEDVCAELGGKDPKSFANALITEHWYILCPSIKTVKANIDFLRVSLKLGHLELLDALQSSKVSIGQVLSLPNDALKNNSKMLEQRLLSEGCRREDIRTMLTTYPGVLKLGPDQFNNTLDCLLKAGITVEQVMKQPKLFDVHDILNRPGKKY